MSGSRAERDAKGRSSLALALLGILLLTSLAPEVGAQGKFAPPLSLAVQFAANMVEPGEALIGSIFVVNTGNEAQAFDMTDSCRILGSVNGGFTAETVRQIDAPCDTVRGTVAPHERVFITRGLTFPAASADGTPFQPGTYHTVFRISPTNNSIAAMFTVTEPRPNLKVFLEQVPEIEVSSLGTFNVLVSNNGNATATGFNVTIGLANRNPGFPAEIIGTTHVRSLAPRDSIRLDIEGRAPSRWGLIKLTAEARIPNDRDTSDNAYSREVRVIGLPDLVIEESGANAWNDSGRVPVFIRNLGDRDLTDVIVEARTQDGSRVLARGLAPHVPASTYAEGGFLMLGPLVRVDLDLPADHADESFLAIVDPDDVIQESEESNNRRALTVMRRPEFSRPPQPTTIPSPNPEFATPTPARIDVRLLMSSDDLDPSPGTRVRYYVSVEPRTDGLPPESRVTFRIGGDVIPGTPMRDVTQPSSGTLRAAWYADATFTGTPIVAWAIANVYGANYTSANITVPASPSAHAQLTVEPIQRAAGVQSRVNATLDRRHAASDAPLWSAYTVEVVDSRFGEASLVTTSVTTAGGDAATLVINVRPTQLGLKEGVLLRIVSAEGGATPVIHVPYSTLPAKLPGSTSEDALASPVVVKQTNDGAQTLVAGVVIAGGFTAVAGAYIAARESSRMKWFSLLAPLYTRLAKDDVLAHETRNKIHALVTANPGLHYSAIKRELGLANGALTHHLRMLEQHGVLVMQSRAHRAHFYPRGPRLPDEPDPVSDFAARVMTQLRRSPGLTQVELADRLGASKQLVNYHVKRLERQDRLRARPDGRVRRLYVPEEIAHNVRDE